MNESQRRETDLLEEAVVQATVPLVRPPVQQRPAFDPSPYRFNLENLKTTYKANHSTFAREVLKWAFSIATFGLGAVYLWATTVIVKEGDVAMRRNAQGKMILLPPGRHSNFPWEAYVREKPTPVRVAGQPQIPALPQNASWTRLTVPVSENFIRFGPNTIFTVKTGYVAKTYRHGELVVFPAGQYLLEDAAHVVNKEDAFISIQEETKVLEPVSALTKNNVPLKIQADVRYKIKDPELAITIVDDIEKTIFELAKINISQVVNHHDLSEFVPVTADPDMHAEEDENESDIESDMAEGELADHNIEEANNKGLSKILKELTGKLKAQFSNRGIELLSISTTSWIIDDAGLAHELGQVAVIQAQARSRLLAARQANKVKKMDAKGDADAAILRATGTATAIKTVTDAFITAGTAMDKNPVAARLYQTNQQGEWFKEGRHTFFANLGANQSAMPTLTLPAGATRGRSMSLGNGTEE